MKIVIFNTKPFEKEFFASANAAYKHELTFLGEPLTTESAHRAKGYDAVCVSVRDSVDEAVSKTLHEKGVKVLALRSAGFDHVDVTAAKKHGLSVIYVPKYSPYAIAEHAVTLMLALNRKIPQVSERTHSYNFSLNDLLGFDMHGKTVGILGTGKIGILTATILQSFGCTVIAYDIFQNPQCKEMGIPYVSLEELYKRSDIISLHCPLTDETHHLINEKAIGQMKNGVMLINTARGQLLDTDAALAGLQSGKIGYLGMDVYENEKGIFFEDKSQEGIQDEKLKKLLSFPNVLITPHQASFTREAKEAIATSVLQTLSELATDKTPPDTGSIL